MNPFERLNAARHKGEEAILSPSDVELLMEIAGPQIEEACKDFDRWKAIVLDHWTNSERDVEKGFEYPDRDDE